jgi:hypothetical protein
MSDADPLAPMAANWGVLAGKAATAITNNQTFLALATPTPAQAAAQIQALTRQVNALIRVQLGILDATDGT